MTGIKFSISFLPKSRFSEKVIQNIVFPKILTKIDIIKNYDQNRDVESFSAKSFFFLQILTKIKIFENLGKHWIF